MNCSDCQAMLTWLSSSVLRAEFSQVGIVRYLLLQHQAGLLVNLFEQNVYCSLLRLSRQLAVVRVELAELLRLLHVYLIFLTK